MRAFLERKIQPKIAERSSFPYIYIYIYIVLINHSISLEITLALKSET